MVKLPSPKELVVVIIRPEIEIKTLDSRKVVKKKVKIEKMVKQSANLGSFISSLYTGDYDLMSRSVIDEIIEPDRALLIPEYYNIKRYLKDWSNCLRNFWFWSINFFLYQKVIFY